MMHSYSEKKDENKKSLIVLILVVMDDALVLLKENPDYLKNLSLNPCCNG